MNAYCKYILNIHVKDRKKGGDISSLGTGDAPLETQILFFIQNLRSTNLIIQGARSDKGDDIGIAREYYNFTRAIVER